MSKESHYIKLKQPKRISRFSCKSLLVSVTRPLVVISVLGLYLIVALGICNLVDRHGGFRYPLTRRHVPRLYEFYTSGGIIEGLRAPSSGFTLNGRPITIYSGAIHYFRVHPAYWRDRLRKARAAGLNAVETYVPWNLHEPQKGEFDFGQGDNDLSLLLDIQRFIKIAQEEDLFVILRPGPYICAEWDFGGLPSWLLRYRQIHVRTSDPIFMQHVRQYFDQLLPRIVNLTFTNGGPIIAFQIENEYGSFGTRKTTRDKVYLQMLRNIYLTHGLKELYFTSDSPITTRDLGSLHGVLQTANLADHAYDNLAVLRSQQPDKALMVMEYWSGWFDHWMQPVHITGHPSFVFAAVLSSILNNNASVNFYMFAGGTSYAFMAGANVKPEFPIYEPDVSSYDYGAPISEAGDYTVKYRTLKSLIAANNPIFTRLPPQPPQTIKTAYSTVEITEYIPILDLLDQVPELERVKIRAINFNSSFEYLPINNGNGQSYGIVAYRKKFQATATTATLKIMGHVRDIAMVLVNGEQLTKAPTDYESLKQFGFWPARNAELIITDLEPGLYYQLDILVENMGRINFGMPPVFRQLKGLWEAPVLLDEHEVTNWNVFALQLKSSWVKRLAGWKRLPRQVRMPDSPAMFRARFTLSSRPNDTFLDMRAWKKGCIYVNGFPLGRYFSLGPQLTNFVPAPLLREGENEIIVFEHYNPATKIKFTDEPNLGKVRKPI